MIVTGIDSRGSGVAPLHEINNSEAQTILIVIIASRNMWRNLAEHQRIINCFNKLHDQQEMFHSLPAITTDSS